MQMPDMRGLALLVKMNFMVSPSAGHGVDMERLPPAFCSKICKNSMSDVCVEDCAVERKCKNFDLNSCTFHDLPSYPVSEFTEMTKEEKAYSLAVYVSKITEFLKGGEDGRTGEIRQGNDYPRSCRIPQTVKK